ncbi:hypothetical protein IMG5_148590 [Ichthyophthirius multifiliis]|uniref:Uncharacterized protein n=1 Tax=Ichthyophthirius multifiliis TaxID=5932 RepID=G0QYB5_ICHMU|nr:hypothetical protein IMG5_148590 [Ichthyophthirius multifiliis]EGR29778.1 hypothetical protein IMG5_148590 [Ichthyophthirius multifiliis]|eukprot:XP_004031014.1 hypothetical protein IMG5_148590 [Ichthyophthirius multifiliis]
MKDQQGLSKLKSQQNKKFEEIIQKNKNGLPVIIKEIVLEPSIDIFFNKQTFSNEQQTQFSYIAPEVYIRNKQLTNNFNEQSAVWNLGMIVCFIFFLIDVEAVETPQQNIQQNSFKLNAYSLGSNYYLDLVRELIENMTFIATENRISIEKAYNKFKKIRKMFSEQTEHGVESNYLVYHSRINFAGENNIDTCTKYDI